MKPEDWLKLLQAIFHGQQGFSSVADWSTPNPPNLRNGYPQVDRPQNFTGNPWRDF